MTVQSTAPLQPATSPVPAPVVLVPAGVLLTTVFVAALVVGGGQPVAATPGLPDAGAFTGWGRPVVDLVGRLLAVLTVGQLAYAALLAPGSPTGATAGAVRALRGATWSAAGWLGAEGAAVVLTASSLYSVPVTQLSPEAVLDLLVQFPAARASLWVALLLVLVVVGSAWLAAGAAGNHRHRVRGASAVLLVAALGAVVVPAVLAGHSATADNHVPAVLALSVHVVTASLWVGGLAGLLLHGRDRSEAVPALRRFSALALACVALLLASGVVAALLVAGPPSWSWTGEGWAQLLAVKTALLAVLAGMGWWHRRRTLPALAAGRPRRFLRLGVVESALMIATVALSVALAASPAPAPPVEATTAATGDSTSQGAVTGVDGDASMPASDAQVEDMSAHDHGDLSVSVLIDQDRFHVAATVRPGQPVTVYNISTSAATITALDGSFDVDVPARTFITFPAPAEVGDYDFVSRSEGGPIDGFADSLLVRDGS